MKFNLSKNSIILCSLFIILLQGCSQPVDFYYLDGREGRLADFKGRWLLINYWAEWCKPCLDEVPELNHFYQQHGDEYAMLSVSFDQATTEELTIQQQKYNIQYPMIASTPVPNLGIGMPSVLPANYLISPTGEQFGPLIGPQSTPSLLKAFKKAKQSYQEKE